MKEVQMYFFEHTKRLHPPPPPSQAQCIETQIIPQHLKRLIPNRNKFGTQVQ